MEYLIKNTDQEQTITSIEIAQLTGTRHSDVLKKIETILSKINDINFNERNFSLVNYTDNKGEKRPMIKMTKSGSLFIASRYDVNLHLAVQLRWEELENKIRQPQQLTRIELLTMALEAEKKVIELEKTKAQISDKKTATAMATASVAVRKANKLEIQLDKSLQYATIKRVQMYTGTKYNWRDLKMKSNELNREIIDVHDINYGSVKAYHLEVWKDLYNVDLRAL